MISLITYTMKWREADGDVSEECYRAGSFEDDIWNNPKFIKMNGRVVLHNSTNDVFTMEFWNEDEFVLKFKIKKKVINRILRTYKSYDLKGAHEWVDRQLALYERSLEYEKYKVFE